MENVIFCAVKVDSGVISNHHITQNVSNAFINPNKIYTNLINAIGIKQVLIFSNKHNYSFFLVVTLFGCPCHLNYRNIHPV